LSCLLLMRLVEIDKGSLIESLPAIEVSDIGGVIFPLVDHRVIMIGVLVGNQNQDGFIHQLAKIDGSVEQ